MSLACQSTLSLAFLLRLSNFPAPAAEVVDTSIIPQRIKTAMRCRLPRDPELAARVQLFKGPATPIKGRAARKVRIHPHTNEAGCAIEVERDGVEIALQSLRL